MQVAVTTELDAVNTLLSIIGEAPVNTVDNSGVIDAVLARSILREISLEVQGRAWHWNTDLSVELLPSADANAYLILPVNTLQVVSVDPWTDVVQRGLKLWDRVNHTFTFVKSVKVNIVKLLDFEEIPQPARSYITVRAGRVFQDRVVGSQALSGFNEKDELRAFVTLKNHEAETAQYSLLRNDRALGRTLLRNFGAWR